MTATPWEAISSQLGYATPKAMWEALYLTQKISISSLAARFRVAPNTIRAELMRHKIEIAKQGGAVFRKVEYNEELDKRIKASSPTQVAIELGVSYTTILKARKRWVEEQKATAPSAGQETGEQSPHNSHSGDDQSR